MEIRCHILEILRECIVCLGIAALLPLFVFYTTTLFIKPQPQAKDHMVPNYPQRMQQSQDENEKKSLFTQQMQMRNVYLKKVEEHTQALFFFSLFAGICALVIGMLVLGIGVGSGLILGGILSIVQGYYFYWIYLTDTLRFVSLLVGIILLFAAGHLKGVRQPSKQS